MKKITFALLLAGAFGTATAQDGNNICVFNAIKNYGEGGGGAALEDGIKCSDEAIVNEKTANVSKTWFYRGNLFTVVATDKDLKGKHPEACLEASKAFTKLNAIADPKFKDWEDANRYLDAV